MNEYYVYVYLDPRKPKYICDDSLSFEYEPFYVGKGKGKRAWCHLDPNDRSKNKLKTDKIKRITNAGYIPKLIFIRENMLEEDAMVLEKSLIMRIGTKWNIKEVPKGPLTNMTSGGDGYTPCIELIEYHRNRMLGEKNPMFGNTHTPEAIEKIRAQSVKLKHSDETKRKMSEARSNGKNYRICHWLIQLPTGQEIIVINIKDFAEEHNISYKTLYNSYYTHKKPVASGNAKGYWLKEKLKYIIQSASMQQDETYTHDKPENVR